VSINRNLCAPLLGLVCAGLAAAQTGLIQTYAGNGTAGFSGDGGPATSASFANPFGLALDASGNLYIAAAGNGRVQAVNAASGVITTFAGGGTGGAGGPATSAELTGPCGVAVDSLGDLYLSDTCTSASAGGGGGTGGGVGSGLIWRVDAVSGIITTVAGGGPSLGDGGPATSAALNLPGGLAIDASNDIFVADYGNQRIRRIDGTTGIITTVAGNGTAAFAGDGGLATAASLNYPVGVAVDPAGNLYIADSYNNRIRRVDAVTGIITTVVGTGSPNFNGDGIAAIGANLTSPFDVILNASGNLVIADTADYRVRMVDRTSGLIWTLAGNGSAPSGSYIGNGSQATEASLASPAGLAISPSGPLYISELQGNRVREVSLPSPYTSTAVTISASGSKVPVGTPVTLTATLSAINGLAANATGGIGFFDGTTTQLAFVPVTNGSASFTTSSLSQGTHAINVVYTGDSAFAYAIAPPFTLTIAAPQATVALAASPNPATANQPVTLTATLTPSTATGTVTFLNGSTSLGTAMATNGVATLSGVTLPAGSYSLTAQYGGGNGFPAATSGAISLTVKATSSVVVTSSANPSSTKQSVTFTATVTPATATGSVQFLDGTTTLGSATLASGSASFTPASLSQGTHSITVSYSGDANDTSATSTVLTQTVQAASTITVTSSANPAVVGAAVTFTATVTPTSATGNVQFLDGTTVLGTVALASGVASFTTSSLSPGSHSITASYAGDANDTSATSAVLAQTVQAASTVTVISSANPAVVGAAVTFTATVAPSSATGNVKFLDGTTVLGTVALASGVASFSTSSLTQGSHSITASYAGDANDTSATSTVLTQTVQASSSVALTSSQNPATLGSAVNLIANVTPNTATGTVQFLDGSTLLGTASIGNNGLAYITTSSLAQGTHSITAVYSGDANDTSATSAVLSQVVKQSVGMTIGYQSPIVAGTTETITANLTSSTATGTVTFTDGSTLLATVPVTSGTAVYSSSTLAQGTHNMTISYSGDTNYLAISSPLTVTVLGSTSTTVASSLNPVLSGQTVTFTATVTPAAATGTVSFYDGQTLLSTVTLTNGVAAYSSSTLALGTHSITANYSGSASYGPSYSATLSEVVKGTTSVTLSSSLNPSTAGSAITFTALVSPSAATGTVQFLDGATVLGSVTLSNGSASFSTSALAAGTHSISASYTGSANYNASNSSVLTEVVKTNTSTLLSSSLNPAAVGSAVKFTAVVTPSTATGTVQFLYGATVLGSATLAGGSASFTTSSLSQGANSITASYSGDGADTASTSAALTETVNPAAPTAPSNLAATDASSSQINLTWSASATSGVTYNVYESTTSGFTPSVSNRIASGVAPTSYSATGLNASTTYYYRVTAVNAGGESAATNQASATTAASFGCHLTYSVTSEQKKTFAGAISIENTGSAKITSWTLTWTWSGNQDITESSNAKYKQSGANVTLTNESNNGQINAGATLSGISFDASYSGTNSAPSTFYVNGTVCH
jgi:large repetitive protein